VYLALTHVEMLPAKMISKKLDVSKPDVYRVLGNLQKQGLVEKIISNPAVFRAVPIDQSLSILFQRKEREFNNLRQKNERLRLNFKNSKIAESFRDEDHQFILIPEKGAEIEKRRKILKASNQSMDVINLWKRFAKTSYEYAGDDIRALQRGVKIRAITEKPTTRRIPSFFRDFKNSGSFAIKYLPYPPHAVLTIYDRTEALLVISPSAGLGETPILWTNNASLLAVMQEYFEMLWAKAERSPEISSCRNVETR
jgi:sugar-specific transcriptional regulator TrmB